MEKKIVICEGFAVVDNIGLVFAEKTKPKAAIYHGSGRTVLGENVRIVPCKIHYSFEEIPEDKTISPQ